jgi:hypothetical protein
MWRFQLDCERISSPIFPPVPQPEHSIITHQLLFLAHTTNLPNSTHAISQPSTLQSHLFPSSPSTTSEAILSNCSSRTSSLNEATSGRKLNDNAFSETLKRIHNLRMSLMEEDVLESTEFDWNDIRDVKCSLLSRSLIRRQSVIFNQRQRIACLVNCNSPQLE